MRKCPFTHEAICLLHDHLHFIIIRLGATGNRTQVTEYNGRTVNYTFDKVYRLTEENIDDPDFGLRTINYTYAAAGNRLMKVDNEDTTTYTYNSNNQLLTETSELDTRTYTYDDNGNTLSRNSDTETITYTYDFQNRMIQAEKEINGVVDETVDFGYDVDGVRVKKTVNGSDISKYLVDKNRDFSQVIEEIDGSGFLTCSYVHGLDLISQNRNGDVSYYHYDGQHSTRQLTDLSAEITDDYTYDAFGLLLQRSGSTENNFLYTGEQFDPNVGFYYLRARYYNPSVGRFLTMDTFPGMQFEPASLHRYLYCEGNPVGNWDPSGKGTYTLFETTAKIGLRIILSSISYVSATHLISWLAGKKEPIEWNGWMLVITVSPSQIQWGLGLILAGLTGTHEGACISKFYIIVMSGIALGPYDICASIQPVSLKTPSLFGLNPFTLLGPVTWLSLSLTGGYRGLGVGFTGANFFMGMGAGFASFEIIYGRDVGIDVMGGFSFYAN